MSVLLNKFEIFGLLSYQKLFKIIKWHVLLLTIFI